MNGLAKKHFGRLVLGLGVAWCGPAGSFGQEGSVPAFPHFYLVKSTVKPNLVTEYTEAVGGILSASQKQDSGRSWAAYNNFLNAGQPVFYFFLPLENFGVMDNWKPIPEVLASAHGEKKAAKILKTLGRTSEASTSIISFVPNLSNLASGVDPTPPPYVYHIHAKAKPAKVPEYTRFVEQIVAAHKKHEQGMNWVAFTNFAGGSGQEFHFFIRLNKLGEMDGWAPERIMAEALGAEGAAAVMKGLAETATSSSELLRLVPDLSKLPAG